MTLTDTQVLAYLDEHHPHFEWIPASVSPPRYSETDGSLVFEGDTTPPCWALTEDHDLGYGATIRAALEDLLVVRPAR